MTPLLLLLLALLALAAGLLRRGPITPADCEAARRRHPSRLR